MCDNNMPARQDKDEHQLCNQDKRFRRISSNTLQKCTIPAWARHNDLSWTDRMITEFIRQCPCCQVMSRLHLQIKTYPFTFASYNHFEVLHLDRISPVRPDTNDNMFMLVIIYVFSRLIQLYPTNTTTVAETASCTALRSLRYPEVIHTDCEAAFHVRHRVVFNHGLLQ